jgi:hypothetical protein
MTISIKALFDRPLGNAVLEEHFGVKNLLELEWIFLNVIEFKIFISHQIF